MPTNWYYLRDGQTEVGPVSTDELKALARSGQLLPTDLVWQEGSDKRFPAGRIKGLFPAEGAAPPVATAAKPARPSQGQEPPGPVPATPVGTGRRVVPAGIPVTSGSEPHPTLTGETAVAAPRRSGSAGRGAASRSNRSLILGGVGIGVLFLACCGGAGVIGVMMDRAAQKRLAEADDLWASGNKAEAVARYKVVIKDGVSFIEEPRRPVVFQRVIEHDLEQGNLTEARAMVEKALDHRVSLVFDRDDAKRLNAQVQAEREAKRAAEAKTNTGSEPVGTV